MDSIKILGGGISGLTAAINLKKAGFGAEVHERKNYCGKHTTDFQFLENWSFNEEVADFLKRINIRTDFYIKPFHSLEIISPSLRRYTGKSTRPLMYLVKRGDAAGSIDKSLERQAKNNGVKIVYGSKLNPGKADIIATGFKRPKYVGAGVKFRFKHPDMSIVLLDNNLSLRNYSYFIVNDNAGEIACGNPPGIKNIKARLNSTVKRFERILDIKIDIEERFSAAIDFGFLRRAKVDRQYFTGEAAGFQDCLLGFGMVYAFKSGYFAARSIIENLDYDKLWKRDFLKQLKISSSNRALYDRMSNRHFEKLIDILNSRNFIIRKLRGGDDIQHIMRKLYNSRFLLIPRILAFS
jgi:flavin-dependent dehydrogenase